MAAERQHRWKAADIRSGTISDHPMCAEGESIHVSVSAVCTTRGGYRDRAGGDGR